MPSILKLSLKKLPGGVLQGRITSVPVSDPKAVKTGPEYAKMYRAALDQLMPIVRLDLIIDSPGGAVESAIGLADALDAIDRPIRVLIAGRCCSGATLPVYYCDNVESVSITPTGSIMVHMPKIERYSRKRGSTIWNVVERMGNASTAHLFIGAYAARTKQHKRTIREWMENGTTFSPEQAVAAGLADRIVERHIWEGEYALPE